MKSIDLQLKLEGLLLDACLEHFEYMKADLSRKHVFSYTIYCSSGFRSIGIGSCTREWLEHRQLKISNINEPSWYAEVNACEWDYINEHYEVFQKVDGFIDELFEIFYDGNLGDLNLDNFCDDELWQFIGNFFTQVILNVFDSLKHMGVFKAPFFEKDLLLGVQFDDPSIFSVEVIKKISFALNVSSWHSKIILNYA